MIHDDPPKCEYFDISVRVADMPYDQVDFSELLDNGLVSHSDSDALRDICGRVVRVLGGDEHMRVRFLRLGNSFRTRAMRTSAIHPGGGYNYYDQYFGVLHGRVDVHREICFPNRVVIVAGTVHGIPEAQIKIVGLDDP